VFSYRFHLTEAGSEALAHGLGLHPQAQRQSAAPRGETGSSGAAAARAAVVSRGTSAVKHQGLGLNDCR